MAGQGYSKRHSFFIDEYGRGWFLGDNTKYCGGLGDNIDRSELTNVSFFNSIGPIKKIVTQDTGTLFLMKNGDVYFVGENKRNMTGLGDNIIQVPTKLCITGVTDVGISNDTIYLITPDSNTSLHIGGKVYFYAGSSNGYHNTKYVVLSPDNYIYTNVTVFSNDIHGCVIRQGSNNYINLFGHKVRSDSHVYCDGNYLGDSYHNGVQLKTLAGMTITGCTMSYYTDSNTAKIYVTTLVEDIYSLTATNSTMIAVTKVVSELDVPNLGHLEVFQSMTPNILMYRPLNGPMCSYGANVDTTKWFPPIKADLKSSIGAYIRPSFWLLFMQSNTIPAYVENADASMFEKDTICVYTGHQTDISERFSANIIISNALKKLVLFRYHNVNEYIAQNIPESTNSQSTSNTTKTSYAIEIPKYIMDYPEGVNTLFDGCLSTPKEFNYVDLGNGATIPEPVTPDYNTLANWFSAPPSESPLWVKIVE